MKKITTERQKTVWLNAVKNTDIHTIQKMIKEDINVNTHDEYRWTALHWSCCCGGIELTKLLINNGADFAMTDIYGDTPRDYLKRTYPQKYEELMVWLAEHHPEKALELMASENIQGNGTGL